MAPWGAPERLGALFSYVNATLLGSSRLSKIALSVCHIHTAKCRKQRRFTVTRSISSNGGPALLQKPRHQLIQPSFRWDINILRLDLPYVLLAKLDSGKFMRWLRRPLCIVKRGRLVFSSPPAI